MISRSARASSLAIDRTAGVFGAKPFRCLRADLKYLDRGVTEIAENYSPRVIGFKSAPFTRGNIAMKLERFIKRNKAANKDRVYEYLPADRPATRGAR